MTIERPMLPPRAESVDSFSAQPAIGQQKAEKRTSESRKPALAGLATVSVAWPAAATEPDPIFAAIERHRDLSAGYTAAVDVSSKLEAGAEFDAADAIAGERCRSLMDHAEALIRLKPTTLAGAIALKRYFASLEEWQTPADHCEEGDTAAAADWHQMFLTTLAGALEKMMVQG